MRIRWQWEPRDMWIGVYWTSEEVATGRLMTAWVCLLPCLPVVIQVARRG